MLDSSLKRNAKKKVKKKKKKVCLQQARFVFILWLTLEFLHDLISLRIILIKKIII